MIGRNAVVAVGLWLPISISALPRLSYAPWNFDYGKVAFYPDGLRGCLLQGNAHRYSGNLLRDLACSADGGQHWTVVAERIAGLAELRLHSDSVHGWAVGERVVLRTEDGGRTWDRIAVDVDGWPNSAHFAKDALGGLGSWSRSLQSRRSPSALRTSDGGRNWLAVDFGITHTEVYDTYLSPDGKHAWALLNTSDFGMTPPNVVIAKSSDGGVRWVVERTFPTTSLWGRPTFDQDPTGEYVLITLAGGPILYGEAGGEWKDFPQREGQDGHSVAGVSPRGKAIFGIRGYSSPNQLFKTTAAGTKWTSIRLPQETFDPEYVFVLDDRTVWVSGAHGLLLRSDDAGGSWNVVSCGPGWADINFWSVTTSTDGKFVWGVGEQGTTISSADGGSTWIGGTHAASTSVALKRVKFLPDNTRGVAAGDEETIMRTADGGRTWKRCKTPVSSQYPPPNIRDIALSPDGGRAWAVGDGGLILISTDGAESWQPISVDVPTIPSDLSGFSGAGAPPRVSFIGLFMDSDGLTGDAYTNIGLNFKTSDGGKSWSGNQLFGPLDADPVTVGYPHAETVSFSNDGVHGCAAGGRWTFGAPLVAEAVCTGDGGRTWYYSEFVPGILGTVEKLAFQASGKVGLAKLALPRSTVDFRSWARTLDGGLRWFLVPESAMPVAARSVTYVPTGKTFWGVGDRGLLFHGEDSDAGPQIGDFSVSLPELKADIVVNETARNASVSGYITVSGYGMNLLGMQARRSFTLDKPQIDPWPPEMFRDGEEYAFTLTVFDGWNFAERSERVRFGPAVLSSSESGDEIEELNGLDLNRTIVAIRGEELRAQDILTRSNGKTRVKPEAPPAMGGADGFFAGFIRDTGQRLTLIKEQGTLRLFRPYRKSYALLIAIGEYPEGSGFSRLPKAVDQAKELKHALEAQGFEILPPLFDKNATAENIRDALRRAPATEHDRLFVYFGGHGGDIETVDKKLYGYIVPYDAVKTNLDAKGIPLEELRGRFSKIIQAKQVLFALDSCQSGLAIDRGERDKDAERLRALRDIEAMSREPGRMFLTAGTGGQPAIDINGGIFTHALIEAIQGKADVPPVGVTTFYKLYEYVRSQVNYDAQSVGRKQDVGEDNVMGRRGWVFVNDRSLLP